MADSKWTFLQTFTPQFQAISSELVSKIEAAKLAQSPTPESLHEISILITKATKTLADATGAIPAYDQRQYEIQVKKFEKAVESLRASNVPKSKFAFKRKAPASATAAPMPPAEPKAESEYSTPEAANPETTSTSTNLVLSSQSHKYITRTELPPHAQRTDLTISDLDNCVVDLLPPVTGVEDPDAHMVVSALHARNLTNCIILLPGVEGSALLHDLSQCVIVLGCHQFRMHTSKKIDVLVSIASTPIIEHCTGIRFAKYPDNFKTRTERAKTQPAISVQDFSHIRATPSPNFSLMDNDDKSRVEHALEGLRSTRDSTTDLSGIFFPK